eukprot:351851-Chlamydomonas_euryale.AAC.5
MTSHVPDFCLDHILPHACSLRGCTAGEGRNAMCVLLPRPLQPARGEARRRVDGRGGCKLCQGMVDEVGGERWRGGKGIGARGGGTICCLHRGWVPLNPQEAVDICEVGDVCIDGRVALG